MCLDISRDVKFDISRATIGSPKITVTRYPFSPTIKQNIVFAYIQSARTLETVEILEIRN